MCFFNNNHIGALMDRTDFNLIINKIKDLFNYEEVSAIAYRTGFCQRNRKTDPYELFLAILTGFLCGQLHAIADLVRQYNSLHECHLNYKPCHKQLSKKAFPIFMRALVVDFLEKTSLNTLKILKNDAFSQFKEIYLHDGTSFALNPKLKHHYPGRFTLNGEAAVELHVTMSLLGNQVRKIWLAADKESEIVIMLGC